MKKNVIRALACVATLWLVAFGRMNAAAQEGEQLFWQGKMYEMLVTPLQQNQQVKDFVRQLATGKKRASCSRGYVGYWSIVDDMLYLDSIRTEEKTIIPQDDSVLSEFCTDGRMAATWVSTSLRVVSGKEIASETMGFNRYYDHEDFINVKMGKVGKVESYEQKCLIEKLQDSEKDKLMNDFMTAIRPELAKRFPDESMKTYTLLYAEGVQYDGFDDQNNPTGVKLTMRNGGKNIESEMMKYFAEELCKYLLEKRYIPLYILKDKVAQNSWTIRIPQEK